MSRRGAEAAEKKVIVANREMPIRDRLSMNHRDLNQITAAVIKAAIAVHKALGPGLLESVYERCMVLELRAMGLKVESQVSVPVMYRGEQIHDQGFRIDLLVEDEVIVELKSCEEIRPVFQKTLLTYLRLSKKHVGLLINFNEPLLKNGIVRVVDALDESPRHESASPDSRQRKNLCVLCVSACNQIRDSVDE